MPKVQLKIEVNDNAESEKLGDITNQVNGEGSNANVSNVSIEATDSGIYVIGAMNKNGREMLSFGEDGNLVFNIDGFLSSNGVKAGALASEQDPDMFVWGVVPASKEYHVKLTFINAKNLREIVVYGDPVANQFPTEAIVNGTTTIYSDDNRWAINLGSESTTHTIEFTKWNRADYNACLTLIKVMLRYFEIGNHTGLLDVESLSQSNAQPKEIMYGLVPSTGTARINVFDELRDLIEEGIITNNKNTVEIYVDGKKVQHHITTDSDYENNRVLTMDFENHLSFLDGIYGGRNLTDPMSAYELLSEVLGTLNYTNDQIDSMLDKQIVYGDNENGSVKSYLENITIEYPYLESSTYRETLDKFCVLAQLNLMEDDYGNLKFVSARPVEIKDSEVVVIPVNRQFSTFSKDEFVKNKYVNPYIQYCKFTGEESLFGETKTANFREDNGKTHVITQDGGYNPLIFSDYEEIYDDSKKNPMKNATEVVNYTSQQKTLEYYKVHVYLPISNENIIKDLENLFISVSGDKGGTETTTYTTNLGDETIIETSNHAPYKTTNYSLMLKLKDEEKISTNLVNTHILNVVKNKNYVEFDMLFWKDIVDISGSLINYTLYVLNSTFQLYGKVYKYEFVNNKSNYDIEVYGNELIQEGTTYNGKKKIHELNRDNIIVDYSRGVRTARVSVGCLDYYNTKGELAVDWSKQEILRVGQVVRVDKDNEGNSIVNYNNGQPYLWKIVGRNFRYSGVPMIDLELQEVKFNTYFLISESLPSGVNVTYTRIHSESGASIGVIDRATTLYQGDIIRIDVATNEIHSISSIKINNEKFINGGTVIVEDNVNVVVETSVRTLTITKDIGEGIILNIKRESSPYANAFLGDINVSDTVYYGDVLIIDWKTETNTFVESAYFNEQRLYSAITNKVTITKNSTITITTSSNDWNTIWEGNLECYLLDDYGSEEEVIIQPDWGESGIYIDTSKRTRLYFEEVRFNYGNLSNNDSSEYLFAYDIFMENDSELLGSVMANATGSFESDPLATISIFGYDSLKIVRTMGIYENADCMFSYFRLVKIEQYV